MEHTKHAKITSEVRDTILKLSNAGIKLTEIAEILNVSYSSAAYTMQCYRAVESDDWETLNKISNCQGQSVKWALEKFGKTLPENTGNEQDSAPVQQDSVPVDESWGERFDEIQKALNGIGFILSEILSELRG